MSAQRVSRTSVLIVDDHPLFREAVRRLIETEGDLEVAGECADGDDAVALATTLRPDVVLLDVNMPGGGPEAISRLRANAPDARVLLLTSGIERGELKRALGHGARGLLLKTSAAALVLKAVRAVAAGEYWIGRDLVGDLAAEAFAPQPPAPDLTQREKQVLALAAEGYGNREIAARLGISEHTVKHHITSLFEKTGRTSRVDLAVYAMQQGIAGPDPN